jgi:DNA-directed RNA polymerase subunit N (RpoN/RPB10)
MLPPVRCFTCGKVIADKYEYYVKEVLSMSSKDKKEEKPKVDMRHFDGTFTGPILDKLGLDRYCCRRMILGTEDMMDTI